MTDSDTPAFTTPKPWRGRRARRMAWVAGLTGIMREAYDEVRADARQFNQHYALGRPMPKARRLVEQAERARRKKARERAARRRAEAAATTRKTAAPRR